jgi:uncharacterized iron-regulated membrane protein
MKLKPLLFYVHRWLGVGMCLLFALWFASGIVMMYVEYPELTEQERVENLPYLDTARVLFTPDEAASAIGIGKLFSKVTLTSILGRPAYLLRAESGQTLTVFADTAELLQGLNTELARVAVIESGFASESAGPTYNETIQLDQWTVSAGLDSFRPLHRIYVNDAAETILYVSDKTGQIVRDTHRKERFWNWLGSTIHWIYPVQLRKNASLWNDVIVYLSLLGIISVITGTIIGFMRIQFRNPYRGENISPYSGWMKWHHLLGLCSLVFVSTFIFSGLMSMGPWGVFNSSTSAVPQLSRYTGGGYIFLSSLPMPDLRNFEMPVKEISWHQIQDTSYYSITYSYGEKSVGFDPTNSENESLTLLSKIEEAAPVLLPNAELLAMDTILDPDTYYYSHHNRHRPFPVYRVKFDDPESTWYHIDLTTGEIVNRVTNASRRERWLFNGLHSLDFQFLLQNRPLWDLLVIALSVIGLGFSLTSVVIGWRRLVR